MAPKSRKATILVPVDFTRTSERGLEKAGELARSLDGRLVVVFVTPSCKQYDRFSTGAGLYEEGSLVDLNARLRRLGAARAGEDVEVWSVVLFSESPADTIVRYAVDIKAAMIVMGTHARTGLDHLIRSSVAEEVVRYASCPVVTVGPPRERAARKRARLSQTGA